MGETAVGKRKPSRDALTTLVDARINERLKSAKSYLLGFAAALALVGVVGVVAKNALLVPFMRWAYPPETISAEIAKLSPSLGSDIEKLGSELFERFGDRVDSGYSKTMIFRPGVVPTDNYMVFYALPSQSVRGTIEPGAGNEGLEYVLTVDQRPKTFSHRLVDQSLTGFLNPETDDASPGTNLHTLRISPTKSVDTELVVTCIVLVRNKRDVK